MPPLQITEVKELKLSTPKIIMAKVYRKCYIIEKAETIKIKLNLKYD